MTDFDSLREDVPEYVGSILKALESQRDLNEAWTRLFEAYSDEIASLWKDNAALRDEIHAVANRVESLTRAHLTEPAEVAHKIWMDGTETCPVCGGSGGSLDPAVRCENCEGFGRVTAAAPRKAGES